MLIMLSFRHGHEYHQNLVRRNHESTLTGLKAMATITVRASSWARPASSARSTPTRDSKPPSRSRSIRKPENLSTATPPSPLPSPQPAALLWRWSTTLGMRWWRFIGWAA